MACVMSQNLFTSRLAAYERAAIAEADARGIGEPGTRGEDNARDAFRHAYISALLVQEFGIYSRPFIRSAGQQLEMKHLGATCPPRLQSSAMDLANNDRGLRYNPASGESPADYAHRLLNAGALITQPHDAPAIGWLTRTAKKLAKTCATEGR